MEKPAWQRPILPGPFGPSTFGAGGLNGRVRNGYAWFPSAIATKRVERHALSKLNASVFASFLRSCALFALLRKEVIQPHLPIRLPCYDFTPIVCPTFGGWLLAVTSPTSGVAN